MRLDPTAVEAGVRLLSLATVGSTNTEARVRADAGERGPLWITATTQSEGRGRRGRLWASPRGNLHASLLLCDPAPFERAAELAFVAALALRDAIVAEAPALAPRLNFKWPNDLLLSDHKCAGILIEGEVDANTGVVVIIGIGVNCAEHPPAMTAGETLVFPATDLRVQGADVTAERLFTRLSATMCRRLAQWDQGSGLSAILDEWISAARGIGETICVRNGLSEKTGRFVGLDRAGRLMLEIPGGLLETISAGDVFALARGERPGTRRQD